MEVAPGVFGSNLATKEWEDDLEVGGEVHTLCDLPDMQAGLSRSTEQPDGPVAFVPDKRETILILEGSVRIEIKDGPTLELSQGDMASIPKGAETLWHITAPFKEMWFMA
jgi:mannose-6-phosphate isomerase-like protein (cupin superfamily)